MNPRRELHSASVPQVLLANFSARKLVCKVKQRYDRIYTNDLLLKHVIEAGQWWRMPLILALGRQRQADLCVQGQPDLPELAPGQLGLLYREALSRKTK